MAWYPVLGYGAFWLGLIVAIVLFAAKRRWHPVMYLISVCFYIFTVGFVIDVFELSKNGILLVLAFSAIVMIALGVYLSKVGQKKKRR